MYPHPLAALVAVSLLFPHSGHQHHQAHPYRPHDPGCVTRKCDRRVDRHWAVAHRPKTIIDTFDLCVANNENGEPGSLDPRYIDWRSGAPGHPNSGYEGAFSWEASKWAAGGGLKYAAHAYEATPAQQAAVFHQNGRNGEWTSSNWPTIPPCSGYEP